MPRLAAALTAWFREHGRDYPWRRTADPYAILVSEIMLQQTQISTVLDRGYYERWMRRFPDFQSLATADEAEVLKSWEGLGYYRRARNLHRLAVVVMRDFAGEFPREIAKIQSLPGIGPYTAGAVASFAFDQPQPIVDGNVARVLSRLFDDATPIDSTAGKKKLWRRAESLVRSAESPRLLNSALMELGQAICRPASPSCAQCPVRIFCRTKRPDDLPVKRAKTMITAVTERVFFFETGDGILLEQETGNRRTGLWKLPALPDAARLPPVLLESAYTITRYRVALFVHEPPRKHPAWPASHRFIARADLPALPMPSPYRRALDTVLSQLPAALTPSCTHRESR